MSSTGGALTSADSPPSMSRFSCRSTWPIRRFSVTLASRPAAADRRQARPSARSTAASPGRSRRRARDSCRRAAARRDDARARQPLIQPSSAAWNAGRSRCASLSKPRPMLGAARSHRACSMCRSNGPAVQQHERAFGQRRLVARLTQVVQQRQQRQRNVFAAAEQPLEIGWQLHHRARQRFDALLGLRARPSLRRVAGTCAPSPRRAARRRGSRRS